MKLYMGYIVLATSTDANRTIALFKERKVWVNPLPKMVMGGYEVLFAGATANDVNDIKNHFNVVDKLVGEDTKAPQEEEH